MFSPMTPPLSYYGGKQKLAHKIVPLIPRHTVYVEPFAGGATILFKKPWPVVKNNNHYREYINDKDGDLINFYRMLQKPALRDELIEKLLFTPYAEAEHSLARSLEKASDLDRAWSYFVRVQQAFNKIPTKGWGRDVYSGNSAVSWVNKVNNLTDYLIRMQGVFISNQDALVCIRQLDSPQTFFYCDPPYPGTDCAHYGGYTVESYRNLVETLDRCQGSFLLSNYDKQEVTKPPTWERFEFDSVNRSRGRGGYDRSKAGDESGQNRSRTEIVWRRFNRVPVRPEIQKLYDSGAFDCFASEASAWEF